MKIKPLTVTRHTILQLVLVSLVLMVYLRRPRPSPAEAARLMFALQKYSQDLVQQGRPRSSVPLEELVIAGYLTAREARPFPGADATFSPPSPDHNPRQILIQLHLRDGGLVWLVGDGTIRLFPPP